MWLRKAIRMAAPKGLRIGVALARRAWRDWGARPRLARARVGENGFRPALEIVQEIKPSAFLEGKLANLRLGAERLDGVIIAPGETFSFWKLVGRPSAAAGFAVGRSIRGDQVGGDVGGGLCQLSGITYETGLRAGLDVIERHPHSRDLYGEEDRFTPLGLDATVVWPYKDLRLRNPFSTPVQLRFAVRDMTLAAGILAPQALDPATIDIERIDREGLREVRVSRATGDGAAELVSDDLYAVI